MTFWILALCAAGGIVSGVALGPEWLRKANDSGVQNVAMLLPGLVLLGSAIIFRVSMIQRGKADKITGFFSRLAWAAIFGAAAQCGTGWLGRWPAVDALWTVHEALQVVALVLTSLSFVSLVTNALSSEKLIFKIPAGALALAAGTIVAQSVVEIATGIFVGRIWVALVIVSAAVLRMAAITPNRKRKAKTWRRNSTETTG